MASVQRRRRAVSRCARRTQSLGCSYALIPVAACSLFAGTSAAEAASAPFVLDADGKFTLSEAAGGGISFPVEREAESSSFRFSYAPGADQGPETWYLIKLDVSVTFGTDSKPGSVLVSGFSRGQAGAQIEFYPERGKDGEPLVSWASVDLIRGQASGRSRGNKARVHYVNYLPFAGVRPGQASLSFQVERFGGAKASEVRIGPSSGIYSTEAGPVQLKVSADTPDEEVLTPGGPARLEVEVSNLSTRPARDVVVSILPQASDMFVEGPAERTIGLLEGTTSTEFTVGRTNPGRLQIKAVAVARNGARAQAVVKARVAGGREDEKSFKPWIAMAIAAIVAAGATALIRGRKQRGEKS